MVKLSRVLAAAFCLLGMGAAMLSTTQTKTYQADTSAFPNAQIGYAPMVGSAYAQDASLRYIELTWRTVEPEEGQYAWDAIDEKYGLAALREQGIHLVLRLVCDTPKNKSHMDIPDWLYQQTGNGSWYDISYGKGYSPDYSDPVFRAAHRRLIAALAEHFGTDVFVSYVELGSLGHWGEWHIKSGEGLVPMPDGAVRDAYVQDYLDFFPDAKLLMRRPFNIAAANGLGVYNDMTGEEKDTDEWLRWLAEGGAYGDEADALTAMPDFWKNAPVGGEFTSGRPMKELLKTDLSSTLELVRKSHMSFIGPKTAEDTYRAGYDAVLKELGYRLRVTELKTLPAAGGTAVTLTLANDGAAPFYWDWDVNLYVESASGDTLQTVPLGISLPSLMPGEQTTVTVTLEGVSFSKGLFRSGPQLTLGIVDPMTGRDAVRFAMKAEQRNGRVVLL